MGEVYLEALQNYLNGSEWRQSIEMFVQSNCKYFYNVEEMDHQQYQLWKSFQEIVETILEMALSNVGGSIDLLESSLDEVYRQPSRGPRDDLVKDVLDRLLSFSDFQSFALMMKSACDEQEDSTDEKKSTIDSLLRMGFTTAAIDAVLEQMDPSTCSVESLVTALSMYISGSTDRKADEMDEEFKLQMLQLQTEQEQQQQQGVEFVDPHDPNTVINSPSKGISRALLKFIEEARDEGTVLDVNELNAKFVIADSVLDTFDSNALAEMPLIASVETQGQGLGIIDLLKWAEQMKLLYHDIVTAHNEQLPCNAMCFNCSDGLVQWYLDLEETRRELERNQSTGSMISDSELRRMAELDRIAALGTADEQLLHSLISRHDEVRQELNKLHRQCGIIVASERYTQRLNLEELYLYLKQQVATGTDLEAITENLQEQTESTVSSAKGVEVINLLLDMHIFEEEEIMLRGRIQELIGPLTPAGAKDQDGKLIPGSLSPTAAPGSRSSNVGVIAGGLLRFNDVELDGLRGLAFTNMEDVPIGDFTAEGKLSINESNSATSAAAAVTSVAATVAAAKDNGYGHSQKDHSAASRIDMTPGKRESNNSSQMMQADSKSDSSVGAGKLPMGPLFNNTSETGDTSSTTSYRTNANIDSSQHMVSALKEQHRAALNNLKDLLENERTARLQALDDKLIRRRALQRKALHAADLNNNSTAEDAALVEEHAAAVSEVEEELSTCTRSFDSIRENLIVGFKKRCQAEVNLLQQLASTMDAGSGSKGEATAATVMQLSHAQRGECHRSAADALKEKHRRDYEALVLSLEHERERQRKKIVKALAMKRKGNVPTSTASDVAVIDTSNWSVNEKSELHDELIKMDREFDVQESSALASAQERALLTLAALHISDDLLKLPTAAVAEMDAKGHSSNTEEDDEAITEQRRKTAAWLSNIEAVKSSHCDAAAQLQKRLLLQNSATAAADGSDESDRPFKVSAAATAVSSIVVDSFDARLSNGFETDGPSSNRRHGNNRNNSDEHERVKRGIINEFENAKKKADAALQNSKFNSKSKLEDRRNRQRQRQQQQQQHGAKDSSDENEEEEKHQQQQWEMALAGDNDLLESVMTGFIENKPLPDPQVRRSTGGRSRIAVDDAESVAERSRIKNEHLQREQQLLSDLQANMLSKKKQLEERLRRKREAEDRRHSDAAASTSTSSGESAQLLQIELEADVEKLEQAFNKIATLLKDSNSEDLALLDRRQLMELMEKAARGESISITPSSTAAAAAAASANATLLRPDSQAKVDSESRSLVPPPLHSSPTLDKLAMAGEVQRISMQYNQEQQKHELMMKIQQTRQRQLLQRKLMEKNQAKARTAGSNMFGGAGYSSTGKADSMETGPSLYDIQGDGTTPERSKLATAGKESVLIGKGGAAIQKTNLQPVFKGLPQDAYSGASFKQSGGTPGVANIQRNMTARGLNLTPMLGRK